MYSNSLTHSGLNPGVTNLFFFIFFSFLCHFPCQFKKCMSAKFDQIIWWGSRDMDIFRKRFRSAKMMLPKLHHHFPYQWIDNVKINKYMYANTMCFKSNDLTKMMLSKPTSIKKGYFTCQWLDNDDRHLYAKFDQIYHVVNEL